MRGVFLSLCLSILQLKQSCPARTQDDHERGISEFMFIYLQLKQSCLTSTPDESGISEFMLIYLTIEAVLSYQDTR